MRKEKLITISSGRDEGKKFKIREMGAVKTEKWATRALMLLASSNIDLGVDKDKLKGVEGWNNIAQAGLNKLAEIDFNKIERYIALSILFLSNLFTCYQIGIILCTQVSG